MIIRKPEEFHGYHNRKPYFEGWYHKMSTKDGSSIVLIPGMYRSSIINNEIAFLMIYNGISNKFHYIKIPYKKFYCHKKTYQLDIDNSFFSLDRIKLDIDNTELKIKGEVFCKKLKPWPNTILEPGCMGWYSYLPTMECFHGILSMDHELYGSITINNEEINFNNGKGYIEKDWGRNFPKNWFWTQSNYFNNHDISLSASLATIPWRSKQFTGYIIGLNVKNKLYRFAPYRNSKILKASFNNDIFNLVVKNKNIVLEIESYNGNSSCKLYAPDKKDMIPKVDEYLDSKLNIKLLYKNQLIIEDTSIYATRELVGNTDELIYGV
tara:strand:- start:375 stop:1343 length:969 start_codon:yes stop_codon:yes gene_type:complete